jgi:hypothetical protein
MKFGISSLSSSISGDNTDCRGASGEIINSKDSGRQTEFSEERDIPLNSDNGMDLRSLGDICSS